MISNILNINSFNVNRPTPSLYIYLGKTSLIKHPLYTS